MRTKFKTILLHRGPSSCLVGNDVEMEYNSSLYLLSAPVYEVLF